jgi:hypothetical protein
MYTSKHKACGAQVPLVHRPRWGGERAGSPPGWQSGRGGTTVTRGRGPASISTARPGQASLGWIPAAAAAAAFHIFVCKPKPPSGASHHHHQHQHNHRLGLPTRGEGVRPLLLDPRLSSSEIDLWQGTRNTQPASQPSSKQIERQGALPIGFIGLTPGLARDRPSVRPSGRGKGKGKGKERAALAFFFFFVCREYLFSDPAASSSRHASTSFCFLSHAHIHTPTHTLSVSLFLSLSPLYITSSFDSCRLRCPVRCKSRQSFIYSRHG